MFLLRDPRAVKNSYLKTIYNKFYPEIDFILWKWKDRISQFENLEQKNKETLLIRFEKIVVEPTLKIKRILNLLKQTDQENILDNYQNNMELLGIENHRIHQNIKKGIDHKIANQWQNELDSEIIKKINKRLGPIMSKYGYT